MTQPAPSPCVGVCKLNGDICIGCGRTLQEITEAGLKIPNYIVEIQDSRGRRRIPCETEDEVWKAIGSGYLGSLYNVGSPVGLPIMDFVPY